MKKILLLAASLLVTIAALGEVPQFSSKSYDGWIYNSPVTELNATTILANQIVLYTTSQGLTFLLTSPQFSCSPGQTISMTVTWVTDQWKNSNFVESHVALTAALLDDGGAAVDSVTWTPVDVKRTNVVNLEITVPKGLRTARLRFAAWKGEVNSAGAVRQIVATSFLRGDVNQDGEVTVADVNAVVDVILGGTTDPEIISHADVNLDNEVTIADINDVINIILQ